MSGAAELTELKQLLATMDKEEIASFVEMGCTVASAVTNGLPTVKSMLEDLAKDLAENQTAVSALKQAVKTLEETIAKLMAERDHYLAAVLLGQTAYVLDEVATDFVFHSDTRPYSCSIGTLRNLAADNELTQEQMLRWQKFKTYTSRQGWTIADLVGKSGELRTQRYPLAHGSKEQQEAMTPDMVEAWVNKFYSPDDSMHTLIKLISKFTLPSKPLCKSPHSWSLIEDELKKTTVE